MPFEKGKSGNEQAQFKEGQSGNPAGRPKKLPELDGLIAEVLGEEKDGNTAALAILKKWRQMAASGNLKAGEMLFDRGYGKPKQSTELTGANGGPIDISFDVNKLTTDEAAALLDLIEKAKE